MALKPYTVPNLEHGASCHGFFTRRGGVSKGIYKSLNCGPGSADHAEAVAENRTRVAKHFGTDSRQLCTLYQTHSSQVIEVETPWDAVRTPRGDAMVTKKKGVILGVLAADCAPVLLAEPQAGVIGAAHAGWRGAFAGIIEETVVRMAGLGAKGENIRAAIGPCIAQASYEVGEEFHAGFTTKNPSYKAFFKTSKKGRFLFDLAGFVAARLRACGIKDIAVLGVDTYANERELFSFRRATLKREEDYGRQISAIMLAS